MGVMQCSRKGCTNILCGRYSHDYGYICADCFNELVDKGIDVNIFEFMDSPKNTNPFNSDISMQYFSQIFRSDD